jgi:hypothetical protein
VERSVVLAGCSPRTQSNAFDQHDQQTREAD